MLVLLGGLLVGAWPARGQQFVLNHINDTNLNVTLNPKLTIIVSVTNAVAANSLNWSLGSGAPSGASIVPSSPPNTAVFTWTPTAAQVPSTNSITVKVSDFVDPLNNDATAFIAVIVTNSVTPAGKIVIDPIGPQPVVEGTTLTFTNHAQATDDPAKALVFSLISAPSGATMINNSLTSGVFTWTPTAAQALTPSYTIREMVTEPSASVTNYQDFQVTITRSNNCAQLDAFLAAVQQGGYFLLTNCTTIVLPSALTISKSVILDAGTANVTIAGNNSNRLFTVLAGVANFTLRGITLSGGQDAKGGALYINQGAVVLLTNCTIVGNRATGFDGVAGTVGSSGGVDGGNGGNGAAGRSAYGGAIHNLGDLTMLNCQFLTNGASGGSGGAGGGGGNGTGTLSTGGNGGNGGNGGIGDGGAIYNAGSLSLSNCTFSGNSATGGSGGVGGTNGTGRFAGAPGAGGAGMEGSGAAVYSANNAVILNCTFASNVAQGGDSASGGTDSNADGAPGAPGANSLGGGICNVSAGFLTNCTFSANQVTGGNGGDGGNGTGTLSYGGNGGDGGMGLGGGLYNAGSVVVVNCTFSGGGGVGGTNGLAGSGRFAGTDGTPGLGKGGDIAQGAGTFVLRNTILAASSAGGNAFVNSVSHITDAGYNLSSDASLSLSGTSLKNTDPKISSTLADNGGLTFTLAFVTNTSPAIGKVLAGANPATDQRGIPRPQPQGGLSDIGAYELVTRPAILTQPQSQTIAQGSDATFTVSAFGDSLAYQWRFNGTDISDATSSDYSEAIEAGYYDVIVTNHYGSVTSLTAFLSVSPYTISGKVLNADDGSGVPDVLIQAISGSGGTNSTSTDPDGNYTLTDLDADTYSVVPSPACYLFGPSNITVRVSSNNVFSVNFFATNVAYTISGRITNGTAGVSGVRVYANGTTWVETETDGSYVFSGLCAGSYIVAPSSNCYAITPNSRTVTMGPVDTNGVDFGASAYTISGVITNAPAGVTLALIGTNGLQAYVTNSGNSYGFPSVCGGRYFIVPSKQGYQFLPSTNIATIPPGTNSVNFTAVQVFFISGSVTQGTNGPGLGAITVAVSGPIAANVPTGANGSYLVGGLPPGTYQVTPTAPACYHLNLVTCTVTLGPTDASGTDFVALRDAYTISGRITDGSIGVSDATVQAGSQTTNTDSGGYYVLSGLCSGSYTVTPAAACRLFTPTSISVVVGPNTNGVNFVTFSNNLSRIRGRVTDGVNGLSNVLVTATGGSTSITDPNGNYMFSSLCPGAYAVTPSLSNYCFNPHSLTVSVGSAQTTNLADLVANLGVYRISGTIDHMPIGPTVRVSLVGAYTTNIVTATNGSYIFPSVCPGTYSVTPSTACFQFYPPSWSTTVGPNDDSLNFAVSGGSAFAIGGQVTQGGVGLSNVTVSAGGQTYVTGSDGNYAFSYLCQGVYPVTASSPNFEFAPPTNYVTLSAADANGVNFAATAVFSLSGQVVQGTNGMPGVKISVGTNLSFTGPSGYYTNYNLRGGTNVVVPSLGGYAFAPASQFLTLTSNTSGLNFMAFPSLALARATNGWVQLAFAGAFTCGVEASPNLKSWQPVFTTNNISTNTLILEFIDTNAPTFPKRFYRLTETFTGSPVLTNWAASHSSVSLDGIAAQTLACQIEASTDLKSWTPISTNSLLTNSVPFQFRYGEASNSPVRFYRLFQAPGF